MINHSWQRQIMVRKGGGLMVDSGESTKIHCARWLTTMQVRYVHDHECIRFLIIPKPFKNTCILSYCKMSTEHVQCNKSICWTVGKNNWLCLLTSTTSDLHPVSSPNVILKYADNTYLIIPASSQSTCQLKIHIKGWADWNNLKLNQRKLGYRLCKKTVRHINWTWRMPWKVTL